MREALKGRRRPERLLIAEGVRWDARMQEIRALAASQGISAETAPRAELDELIAEGRHQGVVLFCSGFPYTSFADLNLGGDPVLILDHLQDPQNVGSLLRTAEAFCVRNVVIPRDRSAEITPAVVNSSAGAVEHLRIAQVVNLSRTIESLKAAGYWIIALHQSADAQPLSTLDPPHPWALVVGAEGKGMAAGVVAHCDVLVTIPQRGRLDSLNAAAAGSIALYHLSSAPGNPRQ